VIVVDLKAGTTVNYTFKAVTIEGTFSLGEVNDPMSGELRAVFHLTNAVPVSTEPLGAR
jgi:hypothetical protein